MMQKLVDEIKQLVNFKDTTDIGDIILIVADEPQFIVFALVTDIERDSTRKDEWWNLSFSILSIPIQQMIWTLRTEQMTGLEIFTMEGKNRFIKAVDMGGAQLKPVSPEPTPKGSVLKRIK